MNAITNVSRRQFLVSGSAVALTLGVCLKSEANGARRDDVLAPDAFIRISLDDSVLVVVGRSEMGQGVFTSLPMLIAEELDADWQTVRVQSAPADRAYDNPHFGMQGTGGSNSITSSWDGLRRAGATARVMLLQAAAITWNVAPDECETRSGAVIHRKTERSLRYGALTRVATTLTPPANITLKDPSRYRLIGQPLPRLDLAAKTNGTAVFGIDVVVPGMLVAVVARAPHFGARVVRFDATQSLQVPGVRHVVAIEAGIAVVAADFWAASKGRDQLSIEWTGGVADTFDDESQRVQYAALLDKGGVLVRDQGDVTSARAASARTLAVDYEFPYLAQTPMEPLNCVADVRADRCEVWVGTQIQSYDRAAAAAAAGMNISQVTLHTPLLGGGFGRRGVADGHFVREAVQISKSVRAPVKVIWTRTDDIHGGYYRPAYLHRLVGSIDQRGTLTSLSHRVVGQSVLTGTPFEQQAVRNGADSSSTHMTFYRVPNYRVELHSPKLEVPVWAWRSVGSTHNAFAIECFIDELAFAAGQDPCTYRKPMLDDRHRAVLELAMTKSNWGNELPRGHGRGVAIHQFDSFVAQVVEVSVVNESIRIDRAVCAVDCGTVVNPNLAAAQIEGGIAMGLSAFLHERISFKQGRVVQSNFTDYPILRMSDMPRIEVHFLPSKDPPKGLGEAGVPPIAPAVANAIFAATGRRVRKLPFLTT